MKAVLITDDNETHIGSLTKKIARPMLYVGGKPLPEHQIVLLRKYNITEIIILVNHLKDSIISYFGNGNKWDVELTYIEEFQSLCSIGGTKEVEDILTEDFIVINTNVMINMHLGKFIDFHRKKESGCTLALQPNACRADNNRFELDRNHRIINVCPKPHKEGEYYPRLVDTGVFIFSSAFFQLLIKEKTADFENEIFTKIHSKIRAFGYNTSEYIKHIDTAECNNQVELDWQTGKIERLSYEHKQKAIFLDRDGVINEEISFIIKPEDLILYDFTPAAIRKINQSGYKAIVISNQSAIARNLCTLEELQAIHNKLDTELGRSKAKLDSIYFCPHHPEKGQAKERSEYITDCNCRKPKPGMLLEAANDFNLDLSASFMIGDNGRDIEAGKNAGCITVGVRTGYALKKTKYEPDFFFENLKEAVDYIINEPHKQVYEKIKPSTGKIPLIISIGGNARSGKSTLATYLKYKFQQDGRKVLKIELDKWIVPEDQRHNCINVFERFRFKTIESDLQQILSGSEITLHNYSNHPEKEPITITYKYSGEDLVLIEGVVALSSEIIRDLSHIKIFVETSKQQHFERIKNFYRWKGKSDEEIEKIYANRVADEYMLIEKEINLADFVVNSIAQ